MPATHGYNRLPSIHETQDVDITEYVLDLAERNKMPMR
jgi:hypothetical protein